LVQWTRVNTAETESAFSYIALVDKYPFLLHRPWYAISKLCGSTPVKIVICSLHHGSGKFPSDYPQYLMGTLRALTKPETKEIQNI
jgi:hypothetical protein